jgi:hypothetical protein
MSTKAALLASADSGGAKRAETRVATSTSVPEPRTAYPGEGERRPISGPAIAPGGRVLEQGHPPTGPPGVLSGYLSRDQLALELNVCARTISRWTFEVDGLPHIALGNRTYYRREAVAKWLAGREHQVARTKREKKRDALTAK